MIGFTQIQRTADICSSMNSCAYDLMSFSLNLKRNTVQSVRSSDAVQSVRSSDTVQLVRSSDTVQSVRSSDTVQSVRSSDTVQSVRSSAEGAVLIYETIASLPLFIIVSMPTTEIYNIKRKSCFESKNASNGEDQQIMEGQRRRDEKSALTKVVELHRSYRRGEAFTIIADGTGRTVKVVALARLLVCPFLLQLGTVCVLIRAEGGVRVAPHSSHRSHSCLPA